jgi:NitT/TauT family transport system substrate-binding protein
MMNYLPQLSFPRRRESRLFPQGAKGFFWLADASLLDPRHRGGDNENLRAILPASDKPVRTRRSKIGTAADQQKISNEGNSMFNRASHWLVAIAALFLASPAVAQTKIALGTVQSFGAAVSYIARDKGYFKEQGLDVDISFMNSAANMVSLLATSELQMVEGGVSVGYFNALEKNMPVIMTSDRVSTPIHHLLLVRADLKGKIAGIKDLKGKNVGSNAIGAVTTYELGKMLAKNGMSLQDIELKTLGFPQMIPAMVNGALDATLQIPPFAAEMVSKGIAFPIARVDDLVEPSPMTIAASFVNSDWAAKNKEAMRGFFVAYQRATRDYCLAYHGGPNRAEVMQIALKNGLDSSLANIEKNPWTGRSVDGRVAMPSILDQLDYYIKAGMAQAKAAPEKIFTSEYIDYANAKLGPAPMVNPESKLPGCR